RPQSLPGTGAVRTDQPSAGTPEHRLLTAMASVLNGCRGGGAPELIGWIPGHGYVLMVGGKPTRPGGGWGWPGPGEAVAGNGEHPWSPGRPRDAGLCPGLCQQAGGPGAGAARGRASSAG